MFDQRVRHLRGNLRVHSIAFMTADDVWDLPATVGYLKSDGQWEMFAENLSRQGAGRTGFWGEKD